MGTARATGDCYLVVGGCCCCSPRMAIARVSTWCAKVTSKFCLVIGGEGGATGFDA